MPRETVIGDYLLSNRYFDPNKVVPSDESSAAWKRLPAPVLKAFMGVDRQYIEAVFQVIDAHPGGARGYLRDRLGLSIIYITHDLATAYYISDRIIIMKKGEVVERGNARAVLDNPQHPYSIALKNAVLTPDFA